MRQTLSSCKNLAPCGAPFFLRRVRRLLATLGCCICLGAAAADDVASTVVAGGDFQSVHEALIEVIEGEGLVVSAVIPFNQMLARTAGDLGRAASPFAQAEIVQFCSSLLAWQLLEEDPDQIALCPLSIAVYTTAADAGRVTLAYRRPGPGSAGRGRAENLLRRLVDRSAELGRLRW